MKDFRASQGRAETGSPAQPFGGSAFHLPNIVDSFTRTLGVLSSVGLAVLLRPWRLMQMLPMRRGGLIGAFFAWGRLASIAIAGLLLLSPGYLQSTFPEWRTAALVCFFVSGLSVFAAIARCCSSVAACAFWVVLTLYLGEHAVKPIGNLSVPSFAQQSVDDVPVVQMANNEVDGEWEDLATGRPVSPHVVSAHRNRSLYSRPLVRYAARSILPQSLGSMAASTASSAADTVSSSVFSIIPSTASLWSATGLTPRSAGWSDGAALPESAYFGGSNGKIGAVGTASSGGGVGGGLDQVVGQVASFFGQ